MVASRCSGSRCGSCRCPPSARGAPPGGSAGNSSARKGSEPPFTTFRGMRMAGWAGSKVLSIAGPRGFCGEQQGLAGSAAMARGAPVRRPLPDVAGHVVQAVAVGRVGARRAQVPLEAVGGEVPPGERALPGVGLCMPPGVSSSPQANSAPSSPPRAANSHSASVGSALPAQRRRPRRPRRRPAPPGGPRGPSMLLPGPSGWRQQAPGVQVPPVAIVAGVHRPVGHAEHQRARPQHRRGRRRDRSPGPAAARRRSRSPSPRRSAANSALVTVVASIQKPSTRTRMRRPLLGVVTVGAHQEAASRDRLHPGRRGRGRVLASLGCIRTFPTPWPGAGAAWAAGLWPRRPRCYQCRSGNLSFAERHMLEVRDLILVRAIAEHGSLARAARVLAVGQPALTRSLAGLEARLRGPLFERSRRGVVPTDLCRALLGEAGEILDRLERLDRHLAEVRGAQVRDAVDQRRRLFRRIDRGDRRRPHGRPLSQYPAPPRHGELGGGPPRGAGAGVGDRHRRPQRPGRGAGPAGRAAAPDAGGLPGAAGASAGRARHAARPGADHGLALRLPRPGAAPRAGTAGAGARAGAAGGAAASRLPGADAGKPDRGDDGGAGIRMPWRAPRSSWQRRRSPPGRWWRCPGGPPGWRLQLGILRLRNHQPSEAEAAFLDLLRSADEEAARRGRRFLAQHGFDAPA